MSSHSEAAFAALQSMHTETTGETAHPSSIEFYKHLIDMAETHAAKQQDYGSTDDPFANYQAAARLANAPVWLYPCQRIAENVQRIESFIRNGDLATDTLEESLRDISVLALIAWVLWDRNSDGTSEGHSTDTMNGHDMPAFIAERLKRRA